MVTSYHKLNTLAIKELYSGWDFNVLKLALTTFALLSYSPGVQDSSIIKSQGVEVTAVNLSDLLCLKGLE